MGWWTAATAGGGASGWVLGGVLTEFLGWRAVFWVNLPICLLVLAAVTRALPGGGRRRSRRPDAGGAAMIAAAVGLLVVGLYSAAERGLPDVTSWTPLLLATGISVVLVRHLRRTADPFADPTHEGVASGVLNSAAQIGTAVGLAVVAPLAASAGTDAYREGFVGTCILAGAGLVSSLLLPRRTAPSREVVWPGRRGSARARSPDW